jgi:hypothetical protein
MPLPLDIREESITALKGLLKLCRCKRLDLRWDRQWDFRLEFLERQLDCNSEHHPVYMLLLFKLFLNTANWFRNNNIFPHIQAYLDDKIPRQDNELLNFFLRLPFYTTFSELCKEKLPELLGVSSSQDYVCRVASDDNVAGLVIADAVAYAAGKHFRGQDTQGMYERVLRRMSVDGQIH